MVRSRFSRASGLELGVSTLVARQNQDANTTDLEVSVLLLVGSQGVYSQSVDVSCTIDGRSYSKRVSLRSGANHEQVAFEATQTIAHTADGSKTVAISVTAEADSAGYASVSTSVRLPTIIRKSTVTVGDGVMGSGLPITIHRANSSFTHRLRFVWQGKETTLTNGVGTSYTWQVPLTYATGLPNSTSGQGTLYVDTYSGSNKLGTSQARVTLRVPDTVKPTLSGLTLSDGNRTVSQLLGAGYLAQGLSQLKVSFSGASGSQGSSIVSYRAELVGTNQVVTANGGHFGLVSSPGQVRVRGYVTDSRGRTSVTREATLTVLAYQSPSLSVTGYRARDNPQTIQLSRTASIAPLTVANRQKNTMSLRVLVRELGISNYTEDRAGTVTYTSTASLSKSAINLSGTYRADRTYEVLVRLEDKFSQAEFLITVLPEEAVLSYDKDGRVAVGQVVDTTKPEKSLTVAGDIIARSGSPVGHYTFLNVTDLNQALTAGLYTMHNTTLNQPMELKNWGYLEVIVTSGTTHNNKNNWIWQRVYTTAGRVYERHKVNANSWQPWKAPGLDQLYPVGAVFESTANTNPASLMGGTWQAIAGGTNPTTYRFKRTG